MHQMLKLDMVESRRAEIELWIMYEWVMYGRRWNWNVDSTLSDRIIDSP